MEQIDQEQTNGNVSDTEGAQSNVSHEQYSTTIQDASPANSTLIQATVVQSPHQFSQTAVSVIQPAQASVIQTATSSAKMTISTKRARNAGIFYQEDRHTGVLYFVFVFNYFK